MKSVLLLLCLLGLQMQAQAQSANEQLPEQLQGYSKVSREISSRYIDISALPSCNNSMVLDLADYRAIQGEYSLGPSDFVKGLNNEVIVDQQGIRFIGHAFLLEAKSSLAGAVNGEVASYKVRTLNDLLKAGFCTKQTFQMNSSDNSGSVLSLTLVNRDVIPKKVVISIKTNLNKRLMRWSSTDLDVTSMQITGRVSDNQYYKEAFFRQL